ncbi:MAG: proline--tRNA ligase [Thauera sp.]|jgi:prolyl-tRNA synthetase|nr:proline--tRNA ligase [Thauera sp.]
MRASQFHLATLKEAPADAEIVSHKLMLRSGMIRRIAAGIYSYMPLALRSIRKVENIIREEMNRAGALELTMPLIQPAELWQETGRWTQMGDELLRVSDRHGRDFAVQPTSEEVVTDIARQELKSYRQLPRNFYQIQTKFRDERRPRFGIMRGREFTMKDAYSFDRDEAAAGLSYERMYAAYTRIFDRLGLQYRAVAADTGAIGGDRSHEFQVIADTGEDSIVYCPDSDYAANIELAEALPLLASRAEASEALVRTPTPGRSTCEQVAELLGCSLERTVKSLVLATERPSADGKHTDTTIWLLLVRGDHSLNEVKASKVAPLRDGFRFATEAEIIEHFGCAPGYLGPIGTAKPVKVIADRTVANMSDFICGANTVDFHYTGANWGRDLPEPELVADLRNVTAGEASPDGKGRLAIQRGIEVGHVFYLGTKYSATMNATFLDEDGKPKPFAMGCYGIGVTRILGAAIEQNHDERGIRWPTAIAPFEVVICPVGWGKSEAVREQAQQLYQTLLERGVDVILDDRDERPGVMFADWELVGVPHRITIGERGLKEGLIEYQSRAAAAADKLAPEAMLAQLLSALGRS